MSIQFSDLMTYAQVILNSQQSEIELRAACSRAYYAVWHHSDLMDSKLTDNSGQANTNAGIHERRIKKFSNFPKRNLDNLDEEAYWKVRSIGHMLSLCKSGRHTADYCLDADVTQQSTETLIENCKLLADKISDLLVELEGEEPIHGSAT